MKMVFLVTLGDDGQPLPDPLGGALQALDLGTRDGDSKVPEGSQNRFAALFACFPVVASITSLLDLNDVDSLASSCRQVRENLLSFRSFVLLRTLHCDNDVAGARCARDLVNFCRRLGCETAVCRNCAHKNTQFHGSLSEKVLKKRLRRLCYFDQTVPIELTLSTYMPAWDMFCQCNEHLRGFCQTCYSEIQGVLKAHKDMSSYYGDVLLRRINDVRSGKIETADQDELRHDGVPCARGGSCIAADLSTATKPLEPLFADQRPVSSDATLYTGYQNLVGAPIVENDPLQPGEHYLDADDVNYHIVRYSWGGPDNKQRIQHVGQFFLTPEKAGEVRALCSFCHRIVPSEKDKEDWDPESRS